jgi:uncharacterized protein
MFAGRSLEIAHRYVAWLRRRARWVFAVSAALLGASLYLIAFHLPLHADFAALLPPDAPAVRDLRRLEARVADKDTALILIESQDPVARAGAAALMATRMRGLPPDLVSRVEDDDAVARGFLRERQHLFVPLPDLIAARDALARRIARAKLEANPLYIDVDDPDPADAESAKQLDDLRARRKDASARLDRSSNVSADGRLQLVVVRTGFENTDVAHGKVLLGHMRAARAEATRAYPGVTIGLTGGVVTTVAEHTALFNGIVLSSLVTALLVGLVLVLYFRSAILLVVLIAALVVATLSAFGVAVFTVGHLNAATAFLGAIIAGNGINYGILLIARFLEERRRRELDDALAIAIHGTLRPTLVASLGAAIAYGSLSATSFRGFADFAMIGAVGMLLCWVATYTLLAALVLTLGGRTKLAAGEPLIGRWLVRLFGFRHPGRVLAATLVVTAVASWITYRYIEADPFEYDITNLRSNGTDAVVARHWMERSDAAFGRGITGRTYIAVDSLAEVDQVIAALGRAERPGQAPTIGAIRSIRDLVPADQDQKLAVLSELRTLLDDDALAALDDADRAELATLRPPDQLAAITPDDLPEELRRLLRERDGRIGLLLSVRPALTLDEWDGRDLVRFANSVRRIDLPDGRVVTTSGAAVVFSDILDAIAHDGVRVTIVAAIGLSLMVLVVLGFNRRTASVLLATTIGTLVLVATCALLGLKVNFLDFVALPITLGLGIDYAVNIADREDGDDGDPLDRLRTSGAAVFVCSLTTVIGYGSLLVSDNLAIRGFGTAALIGELTCLTAALVLVPAIVARRARPTDRVA